MRIMRKIGTGCNVKRRDDDPCRSAINGSASEKALIPQLVFGIGEKDKSLSKKLNNSYFE